MIGKSISHYVIEEQLGKGGMGTVYLARDTRLGRNVAIKVLSPDAAGDPAPAGRLLREAKAASSLNHANIVTIHEIGHADGIDFIVMEHVPGQGLAREIRPNGLPIARVLDLAGQIAGAVAAAHRANVVHRDLKPANVIVMPNGCAKVLDFGLARVSPPRESSESATTRATSGLTDTGPVVGTVGYISPEQIQGRPADTRSDVFALGVLMFEMLTGRLPFTGDSNWAVMAATVRGGAPSVASLRPEVSPELSRIVARCLATPPEKRYASAAELADDLARLAPAATAAGTGARSRLSRALAVGSVVLGILAVAVVVRSLVRESRLHWARETAMAEIGRLTAKDDLVGAFLVARRAIEIAGDDAVAKQAWADLSAAVTIASTPAGADVAIRSYLVPGDRWVPLGKTPAASVRIPLGLLRWRLVKTGYDTLEAGQAIDLLEFRLAPVGSAPPGMVLIPHGSLQLESSEEVVLPDYWLDRYEVTNRQFKAFVDAGGYRERRYWKEPFVKEGRSVSWEQAMEALRDGTGRAGPSTWDIGNYPEGQDDFPVSGVSWYEAAAYAVFAGKQLPTAYHWYRASGAFGIFSDILTASNFSGKGPAKVGASGGLGPYGTDDMAGNVKEWCWNLATDGRRYLLGGGWNEESYMFRDEDAQSPFERGPTFGFRCMLQHEPLAPQLVAEIRTFERDPASLKPVAEDLFLAYRRLYDYDPSPLDPRVEATDDSNPAWREERVTVRAPYGNQRLPICLFLPKSGTRPFQPVVFFPGGNAIMRSSSQELQLERVDFFVRSGRALVYPIYQGTYERRAPGPRGPNDLRDIMLQRGQDIRRTVDYIESRQDLDRSRIAFYGLSLGAQLGPLFLAIEPRFRAGVLFSGGFATWDMPPEADPVNFAPRVKVPVLMVNGREDFDLPYATAQLPMFRMLGTAAADKRHAVFAGGHIPPHPQEWIKVILDWMDDRLGPVK